MHDISVLCNMTLYTSFTLTFLHHFLHFFVFLCLFSLVPSHSQHVECLLPELQLLVFLDYYWLSQSFRPCLKSVTVDVVCVGVVHRPHVLSTHFLP